MFQRRIKSGLSCGSSRLRIASTFIGRLLRLAIRQRGACTMVLGREGHHIPSRNAVRGAPPPRSVGHHGKADRASRSRRHRAGVMSVALVLLAAACTNTATPTSEGGGDTGSGEVKNSGVFVHALGGEPESLDPAGATDGGYGNRAIIQVYDYLIDLPPDSAEPIPMLATEVPTLENGLVSEDGLTYTFPIREGVTFHDGTDLTAEDVKYSWDRVMTMNLPEGQASKLSDVITETRVVDDYTFEVEIARPASWFLTTVVYSPPAAIVSQDAVEENGGFGRGGAHQFLTTNMVGTGPYRFISWERGEQLTFEKNEDYWGEVPALDARWEVSPDNSVQVLGMQAGDFDLIEPTPQFVTELQNSDNICFDDSGFLLE